MDGAIQYLNKSFKEGICQQKELTTVALSFSGRGSTNSSSFSLTASLPQAFLNTDLNKQTNRQRKQKETRAKQNFLFDLTVSTPHQTLASILQSRNAKLVNQFTSRVNDEPCDLNVWMKSYGVNIQFK